MNDNKSCIYEVPILSSAHTRLSASVILVLIGTRGVVTVTVTVENMALKGEAEWPQSPRRWSCR